MLSPVDIASGQVSGVDSLSPVTSAVINWQTDESGINRVRPGLATYTVSGLPTDPSIGSEHWKDKTIITTMVSSTGLKKWWYVLDQVPATAHALSDSTAATQVQGLVLGRRAVYAIGTDYIYVTAGGKIQRWGPTLGGLSETLSNSPSCTHIAAIGQRLVANNTANPGDIQWSAIGEGSWTSWPAANATDAEARPDDVVAISENVNELFVWGETTLQVYQVGADPSLPFDAVSTINTGIGARYCFARLDEKFVFLDNQIRLVMSDGRTVEDLSAAIHKDLRGLSDVSDAWCYREEQDQHSNVVFRFPTAKRTFLYDLKGKKWGERDYYASPFHADWPVNSYTYRASDKAHIVGSSLSGGGLMKLDNTVRTDLGGALVSERTTGWQDFGTSSYKRSSMLLLTMRRGTATVGTTPGALEVRVQNDDTGWSDWEPVSVGEPSDYEHTVRLHLGGIFRRRRYGLRYSNSDDVSIVALHDDVTMLEEEQAA